MEDFYITIQLGTILDIHQFIFGMFSLDKEGVFLKCFYVNELNSKTQYEQFIEYMLLHSEYFSLIYFRYSANEKMKKRTRTIHDALKKYKIKSQFSNEWPGTISFDNNHYYKFVLYRSVIDAKTVLCQIDNLFEWDYPSAPMDLCFYKDGFCWFSITAHEHDACLYSDDKNTIEDLTEIGVNLEYARETEDLFWLND